MESTRPVRLQVLCCIALAKRSARFVFQASDNVVLSRPEVSVAAISRTARIEAEQTASALYA